MTINQSVGTQPSADDLTDEQRRGRACSRCGSAASPLHPAGHAYLSTGQSAAPLGFAIVICTACLEMTR